MELGNVSQTTFYSGSYVCQLYVHDAFNVYFTVRANFHQEFRNGKIGSVALLLDLQLKDALSHVHSIGRWNESIIEAVDQPPLVVHWFRPIRAFIIDRK